MVILRTALVVVAATAACFGQGHVCSELQSAIQSTYNFKPAKLTPAQKKIKSAEMDRVWNMIEARFTEMAPCLIAAMDELGADNWFLFDAGGLLEKLDHSPRIHRLILRGCERVDLEDVELGEWMRRLTALALQDVDISGAAERWMRYPRASFEVPIHAFTVRRPEGAFFLYGSMNETAAMPALLKIASDPAHPERELALSLLAHLATPEADAAVRSIDLSAFPATIQNAARTEIDQRATFKPRNPPKLKREEVVGAFEAAANRRDFGPFMDLVANVPDGERDVVTLMKPEDLPLIRKVRRGLAASGNPHLMENYPFFTGIIWTLQSQRR
jgi:hypothetical protein